MYEVIGHEGLRTALSGVQDSFAVLGPPGIGKRGVVHEWAADAEYGEPFVWLNIEQARQLAEKAYAVGAMTALIDGDEVKNWDPLLRPIEEGVLRVAVWATRLPDPVLSRVMVFGAGYLREADILKILARDFPAVGPRPWLAKALMGTFAALERTYEAVQVFEIVNACLADRSIPKIIRDVPDAVLTCLKLACAAKIGVSNLPWSKAALDAIPQKVAWPTVRGNFPTSKNEARNLAYMFFGGVSLG